MSNLPPNNGSGSGSGSGRPNARYPYVLSEWSHNAAANSQSGQPSTAPTYQSPYQNPAPGYFVQTPYPPAAASSQWPSQNPTQAYSLPTAYPLAAGASQWLSQNPTPGYSAQTPYPPAAGGSQWSRQNTEPTYYPQIGFPTTAGNPQSPYQSHAPGYTPQTAQPTVTGSSQWVSQNPASQQTAYPSTVSSLQWTAYQNAAMNDYPQQNAQASAAGPHGLYHAHNPPRSPMAAPEWVGTAAELANVLGRLNLSTTLPPNLFVDLEGTNLGREGSISIVSLFDRSQNKVFLIDLFKLGDEAFSTVTCAHEPKDGDGDVAMTVDDFVEGFGEKKLEDHFMTLKKIFESAEIPKVFFDARPDSDVLFAKHGVELRGVQDLQLMELASRSTVMRNREYLMGLTKCIQFDLRDVLNNGDRNRIRVLRDLGRREVVPALGGSWEVFNQRPLSPTLAHYCVNDVIHMPLLWDVYNKKIRAPFWKFVVARESNKRVEESRREDYEPRGAHKTKGWTWEYLQGLEIEFNGQ